MNKLNLVFAFVLMAFCGTAQTKYEEGMKKALEMYSKAKTADELASSSALFERIGEAEKDKWLPFYYASISNITIGFADDKADKDKIAEKSTQLLDKAEALEANNSEIQCVKNMIATCQMMVDPMSRWKTFGAKASAALEEAKKLDATNPRPYYLEGQGVFNTPKAFGGGKKKALPLFQKSVDLFATFKAASDFHPSWGKEDAEKMLKECTE